MIKKILENRKIDFIVHSYLYQGEHYQTYYIK